MLALLKRHLEPVLVLVLLAYPLISLLGTGRSVREPNLVDRALLGVSAPLQRGLVSVIDSAALAWTRYVSLRQVERENRAMREEIRSLREAVSGMQEMRSENERLRRLLNYAEAQTGSPVAARVVGINPDANRLTRAYRFRRLRHSAQAKRNRDHRSHTYQSPTYPPHRTTVHVPFSRLSGAAHVVRPCAMI